MQPTSDQLLGVFAHVLRGDSFEELDIFISVKPGHITDFRFRWTLGVRQFERKQGCIHKHKASYKDRSSATDCASFESCEVSKIS